ncbi:unnamed protein product [Parnassius mnemosyne]|uniref:DUF5641 domain-containing protein n=1 Tax=Parnassius mnemosyne TaxID=213953 RepID=A0AAV1L1G2_9NEOP
MKTTLDACIKTTQNIEFAEELEDLKTKGKVKRSSKLITLTPYVDDKGLLRVGGRLQSANISQGYKHPIIIPKNTHLGYLLIRDAHERVIPEPNNITDTISPLQRWKLTQRMIRIFWTRWSKEYLNTLQQKHKWHTKVDAPKVGETDLLGTNNTASSWTR